MIEYQGIHYKIDYKIFTAKIVVSKDAKGDVFIPPFVKHNLKKWPTLMNFVNE